MVRPKRRAAPGGYFQAGDYLTVNVSYGFIVGWNCTFTVDRHGYVYFSPFGVSVGKSLLGFAGSLTGNWMLGKPDTVPTPLETRRFLSGHGVNFGGGIVAGLGLSWSPGNGGAWGGGLYMPPQIGGSYNYTPSWLTFRTRARW